jgi:hypothetical protein
MDKNHPAQATFKKMDKIFSSSKNMNLDDLDEQDLERQLCKLPNKHQHEVVQEAVAQ